MAPRLSPPMRRQVDSDSMTSSAPPQPSTKTITRDDVLRLGQQGRPREFLCLAAQVLAIAPHDDAMRFLVAANLGRLGLMTAATAHLDTLQSASQREPDVINLRRALSGLPNDRLDPSQAVAMCRRNLDAAGETLAALHAHLETWQARALQSRWQRGLDGTVFRRDDDAPWIPATGDVLADARVWAASLLPAGAQYAFDAVIEGLSPPWALMQAWESTKAPVLGHTPRVYVVVANPLEALDALAMADLTQPLADPRVEVYAGGGAGERFARALLAKVDYRLPRSAFVTPGPYERATPTVIETIERAHAAQAAEHERLTRECAANYAGRDEASWRARFAAAASQPLRVLISSSRYSTFVQHSARDQAGAWEAQGHSARVLMEPDNHTQLTTVSYLRAIAEHRPDLFTVINFPRSTLAGACPPNLPFVCWLQDAMPHLFSESIGASAGDLDYWAGHCFPELFERYACRRDRALSLPVLADARKFHPGEIDPMLRERLTCDVACVTHHSETVEAMHARLSSQLTAAVPRLQSACGALLGVVEQGITRAGQQGVQAWLAAGTQRVLREALGAEPDARTMTQVLRSFVHPLADRGLRHQTLHWAADLCRAKGWSLRLYGRGWENHPTLAPFAAGELAHGEELRAAYACAGAHLHVSLTSIVHQRLLECLLSGGLCLPRVHPDLLSGCSLTAILDLTRHAPDADEPERVGYEIAKHPAAQRLASIKARFGTPLPGHVLWIRKVKLEGMRRNARLLSPDHDADRVLGDLREVGFASRGDLEDVLTRCITDPAWRWQAAARARAIVRERLTYDASVDALIDLVAGRVGSREEAA